MSSIQTKLMRRPVVFISLIFIIVLVNFYLLHSKVTSNYSFDKYYIIKQENIQDFPVENVVPIDSDSIIPQLAEYVRKEMAENSELLAKLQQNVTDQFTQEFKQQLRDKIRSQYTYELLQLLEKDLSLFEDLKVKFFHDNKQDLMDYVVEDLAKNVPIDHIESISKKINHVISDKMNRKAYYQDIIKDVLVANGPKTKGFSPGDNGIEVPGNLFKEVTLAMFSRHYLTHQRVRFKGGVFEDLQSSHDAVVKAIRNLSPPPKSLVNGNGIVINGGGSYLPGALVVIGQIREMGSKLPIELILNSESEYDKQICEELLPKLNGTCLIIENELGKDFVASLNLQKFQLKVFGLLVSSFDNIITLDADSFPIKNVDDLITSDVYLATKFLLWPDLWHKGTAPKFYEIARFQPGEPVRRNGIANDASFADYVVKNKDTEVMFHDLDGIPAAMGAETGQIVFSKQDHFRSFLLSLYYNIYGHSHYYPLFYQGTYGIGDRETFIPALHVFNEPYNLVKYDLWLAGYEKGGIFEETTIVQHDPQQVEQFFKDWKSWLLSKGKDSRLAPFQDNDFTRNLLKEFKEEKSTPENSYKLPDVLFLHVHKPKIDPIGNTNPDVAVNANIFSRRNLGKPGRYQEEFGKTDWELKFHSISQWLVCKGITSLNFWKSIAKASKSGTCLAVSKYVDFLKSDSQDTGASELNFVKEWKL